MRVERVEKRGLGVAFRFHEWTENRGRMARIELDMLREVGCASIDSTPEHVTFGRRPPMTPFGAAEEMRILGVLRDYAIAVEGAPAIVACPDCHGHRRWEWEKRCGRCGGACVVAAEVTP